MRFQAFTHTMHLSQPFVISAESQEVAHNAFVRLDSQKEWGLGEGVPSPRVTGKTLEDVLAFIAPQAKWVDNVEADEALKMANGMADSIGAGRVEPGPGPAAMDLALLDLAGRADGYSARELLGLPMEASIPTSITVSLGPIDDMVAEAEDHMRKGFNVLKVKLGAEPLATSRLLRALRDHVPEATIRVDANEAWTAHSAATLLPLMERHEVELIEQPFPRDSHEDMAALVKASSIPIVADEMVQGPIDVDIIGRHGLAHGINIKLQKVGGLTTGARMAKRAKEYGLKVMVGCFIESGAGIAAASQLIGACDWADLDGHLLLADNPIPGPPIDLGVVSTPPEAGIGHGATDLDVGTLMDL
ncbi:MAG: dipeptide epimerase [Thermoplasmata archaeon]|nr:MAG: dipeptide epimerase [Thermoplasmata archaeon]